MCVVICVETLRNSGAPVNVLKFRIVIIVSGPFKKVHYRHLAIRRIPSISPSSLEFELEF